MAAQPSPRRVATAEPNVRRRPTGPHFRLPSTHEPSRCTTDAAPPRPLAHRAVDGLYRRGRATWQRWFAPLQPATVEAAWHWLIDIGLRDDQAEVDRAAVCAASSMAVEYGQREQARVWLEQCVAAQLPSGALPDMGGCDSQYHTAHFVRALLACDVETPAWEAALVRACEWLRRRVESASHETPMSLAAMDRWSPTTSRWLALAALHAAGQKMEHKAWIRLVDEQTQRCRATHAREPWIVPSPIYAQAIEGCFDLGLDAAAHGLLRLPASLQRRDGSVPALPGERWVSAEGLARLASAWYRAGERTLGDRAVAALVRRQRADGSFPAYWGRGHQDDGRPAPAASIAYLTAVRRQVAAAFVDPGSILPSEIPALDGRWLAVDRFRAALPDTACVADVGCGTGRFLVPLLARYPAGRWIGVDAQSECLDVLPAAIERRRGEILQIPAAAGELDAVLCVEVLEHALLPERAVAELCRVVRAGGRILIIDKDRACQPLSRHEPWERWFSAAEVASWLGRYCDDVETTAVEHAGSGPKPLFWCWTATRRAA